MSTNAELMKLYSTRILALAADIPHFGRLDHADGTATCRSPQCGSKVTVDVTVNDGMIAEFAQDVKACALGQAAASVVGSAILGQTKTNIQAGRNALAEMLNTGVAAIPAPFDRLEVLAPAAEFKNRHASILLSFDATLAAFEQAKKTAAL